MDHPPKTKFEYWVRFVCASIVFGGLGFCGVLRLLDDFALRTLLVGWVLFTLAAAMMAARYGDAAWSHLISWFT